MNPDKTIPIIVGVSGHRVIRDEDYEALYLSVKTELKRLQTDYPDSRIVMLSSLAEGSDLLCAEAGKELDMPLVVVLPSPLEEYEKDFRGPAKERLHFHCARAEDIFVAPHIEKPPEEGVNRGYLFRQAGIYVASRSHILMALWDGGPGTKAACGTADAVGFALHGNYCPTSGMAFRTDNNTEVLHIFTPRGERTGEAAGTVHVLGNQEAMQRILADTNEFNRQADVLQTGGKTRLPEKASGDAILERMENVSIIAGKLSSQNNDLYKKVLVFLAGAGMLLTFSFLMYDEAHAVWMIFVCGLTLLSAWFMQRFASRSDCHRRYIEYRALAESLRVQLYLRYAGTDIQAADLMSWTQQVETAWIRDAVCALSAGSAPSVCHDIRECWVHGQQKYHQWSEKRSLRDDRVSGNVVSLALTGSAILYCLAVLFELFWGGSCFAPSVILPDVEIYRTWLKILLGTISAVTLFVANYYGKQSLPRILTDHRKMERFYSKMFDQLTQHGQTEELLTILAREELIENGNWCSFQRDNKPDISL